MAATLLTLRPIVGSSWPAAIGLTVLGASVVALSMRWFRVLSSREVELLRRAGIPGNELIIAVMAPADARGGRR